MLENEVVVRLENIIERLNNLLEQGLLTDFKSQKIRLSKKQELLNHLLYLESDISDLANARCAKVLVLHAKSTFNMIEYFEAATIAKKLIDELFDIERQQVFCSVEIKPELKVSLRKAMKIPNLEIKARNVYKFVTELSQIYSWSDIDAFQRGSRTFELVNSEEDFENLLKDGFEDITGGDFGGIKIAFKKKVTCSYTPEQKELLEDEFKNAVSSDVFESYRSGIEILYPESEFEGLYHIYVPKFKKVQ